MFNGLLRNSNIKTIDPKDYARVMTNIASLRAQILAKSKKLKSDKPISKVTTLYRYTTLAKIFRMLVNSNLARENYISELRNKYKKMIKSKLEELNTQLEQNKSDLNVSCAIRRYKNALKDIDSVNFPFDPQYDVLRAAMFEGIEYIDGVLKKKPVVRDRGFLSTTSGEGNPGYFGDNKFIIECTPDSLANEISIEDFSRYGKKEAEHLFAPNTKFKVIESTINFAGSFLPKFVIKLKTV